MSELCHICDLFRTALFGPTNTEEDHLGDQGNDLPRPMPDAPATLRARNRAGASSGVGIAKSRSGERAAGNGRVSTSGPTAPSTAGAPGDEESSEAGGGGAGLGNNGRKSIPRKFTQRPQRGLKASPAYMSFDDVDVEDDDSDGELFSEAPSAPPRNGATGALNAPTPSVYRAPVLENEAGHGRDGPGPGRGGTGGDPPGMPPPPEYSSNAAMTQGAKYAPGHGGDVEHIGAHANGRRGGLPAGVIDERHSGYGLPIPQDGSGVEGARPHAQSITESYHGYKGYPGYEPETPVAGDLAPQGRTGSSESLTARPQHDVPGRRDHAEPTPSNMRRNPRVGHVGGSSMRNVKKHTGSMESDVGEPQPQPQPQPHPHHSHHSHHQPLSISPSGTMDHMTSLGGDSQLASGNQHLVPGAYASRSGSANYRPSPANSIASSFRRDDGTRSIPAMPSEDGMGSVLGTIGDPEDATNDDLQWKRSALKKFHKVMVKGDGLRVVKHNRSGGSQMRIIRYDSDIKALVWNSKRYMKKAGSANVPIVDIKRVGREGSTVSITAAGRGTIGFEPQRIRDAKILEEALRALVDKEERSAMWRG